jgi:septum formation protein
MNASLVLASTSPRRAALLREAGIAFVPIDPLVSDAHEEELADGWRAVGLAPADVARRLAVAKALAAARRAPAGARAILAADTVVVIDGRTLGKPRDLGDARAMIALLAGKTHEVSTGVALLDLASGTLAAEVETSRVSFRAIDEAVLERFLASGTWAGKAGAYGVQDEAAAPLVARVEGSKTNVVGLPIERVRPLLARVAVALLPLLLLIGLTGCPESQKTAAPEPRREGVNPITSATPAPAPAAPPETAAVGTKEPFVPGPEEGLPSSGLPEMTLEIKGKKISVELALTEDSRRLGLMHRDTMEDDHGMLFVFPARDKKFRSFWMHNTRLPLSIAYIRDDGTIINVEEMKAYDESSIFSKEPARLALEMNKGWYHIHGVVAGDKVGGLGDVLSRGE